MNVQTKPALEYLIEEELQGKFTPQFSQITIGTSAVMLVPRNYERLALTLVNFGSTIVVVRPDESPGSSTGFALAANGGTLSLNWRNDLILPGLSWYGAQYTATGNIYVIELVRYKGL